MPSLYAINSSLDGGKTASNKAGWENSLDPASEQSISAKAPLATSSGDYFSGISHLTCQHLRPPGGQSTIGTPGGGAGGSHGTSGLTAAATAQTAQTNNDMIPAVGRCAVALSRGDGFERLGTLVAKISDRGGEQEPPLTVGRCLVRVAIVREQALRHFASRAMQNVRQ